MAEGQAALPVRVDSSRWAMPDPALADPSGVVAVGGDLDPPTLVDAYRRGIFPWPHTGMALPWFSPDPRSVLCPEDVRVTRSLRQTLRHSGWVTTVDSAFDEVIAACADRPWREGTWISRSMRHAYTRLHRLGWAHSVEVWDDRRRLVGGLYGVRVGGCFTGESMFHRSTDASKVALVDLCHRWGDAGGEMIDVQLPTEHLASMGAVEVARPVFLDRLAGVRDLVVCIATGELPVSRLAPAR